jgi:NADPH2:quinone reductase
MKAIVMAATGGPGVLQLRELPAPALADDAYCLIRLAAAGVNPLDCRIRRQQPYYPHHFPAILGCDGAGIVERAGPACRRFKPGDAVYFFNGGLGGPQAGTYAQYAAVREDYIARKPANVSMQEAAALPLVLITAWEALVNRGGIEPGQRVLVHAGAGGVGHIAVQLARFLRARVAATVSTAEKAALVRELGAECTIAYLEQDFVTAARDWSEQEGVDLVLDSIGGDTFLRSIAAVRIYGRLVSLLATPLDLPHANRARAVNLTLGYVAMAAPSIGGNHRARLAQTRILEQGTRLVEQGKIRPVVSDVYPLERAADAHAAIETGHVHGKIVLDLEPR